MSNRRWIADSTIHNDGSLGTPRSEAIRRFIALNPAAGRDLPSCGAAAHRDPFEETFHPGALAPHQLEEFAHLEVRRFFPKECLHAPANVRRSPRRKAIPSGDDPVVAQGIQHCDSELPGDSTMPLRKEGCR
jgi:hypothetical protein